MSEYYAITVKRTPKKTIREIFQCDNLISFVHIAQTLKTSPERYNSLMLSEQAPRSIKRKDYITIYHLVS
jgi:hypothetical protein